MTSALALHGLRKSFGATEIIRGVDLDVPQGEIHAVIGPNGAGKSTLFNLITGRYPVSGGRVQLNGIDITGLAPHAIARLGLSRSFQITNIFPRLSVFENVRCALLWQAGMGYAFWRSVARRRDLTERASAILTDIGLSARSDLPAGLLAYSDQRALEIGITVAASAGVILLDEPTAGMSRSETERTVALIRKVARDRTLVIIEHDMSVVFGLADRISVLVYGQIIATGTPAEIRANRDVQSAYLGTRAA